MLIFGLHSTSDDQPSYQSNESQPKCKKWLPNHQKMKCSLLSTKWVDYVEEPMKYQALRSKFFSVGGWGMVGWVVVGRGGVVVGWVGMWVVGWWGGRGG